MDKTLNKPISRGDATRGELKRAARRLFATRGIAAVGMREIVGAAGQRNAAAVHYYFGSKDDLLRELLVDGAKSIDEVRQALLDEAEADGPIRFEDVMRAFVLPGLDIVGDTGESETYLRFIGNLQRERRDLFDETVRGKFSEGYERCLNHFRHFLKDEPLADVNRRLLFAGISMQSILEAREAALDASDTGDHRFWSQPDMVDKLQKSIEAIIIVRS